LPSIVEKVLSDHRKPGAINTKASNAAG